LAVITRIATAAPRGFQAEMTSSMNFQLYWPSCGSTSAQSNRM
jgi:hypothetical protein